MECTIVPSFSAYSLACRRHSCAAGSMKLTIIGGSHHVAAAAAPGFRQQVEKIFLKSSNETTSFRRPFNPSGLLRQRSPAGGDFIHSFRVRAASSQPLESDTKSTWESVTNGIQVLYKFARPRTVKGTILGITSMSLLAIQKTSDFSPAFFIGLLQAITAFLCMNVYIVGVNQLTDIEIDKVNKPYLPLASGEYSYRTGVLIVSACATMAFGIALISGSRTLFGALCVSFLLGSVYSIDLPLLRWKKKSNFLAAMCIVTYRAFVVQLAAFFHMQTFVFQRALVFPRPLIFAVSFMFIFAATIAISKDIPDYKGDTDFGIQTFTVRLGVERVFWFCTFLLESAYLLGIVFGALTPTLWSKIVMVFGHTLIGVLLWNRAKSTDLKSRVATTAFCMFIWKLFYAEYMLIPLLR